MDHLFTPAGLLKILGCLLICFVDLEDVFNPVISEVFWELLWEYGYETVGPNTRFETLCSEKHIFYLEIELEYRNRK